MKKTFIAITLSVFYFTAQAQKVKTNQNTMSIAQIEDRLALKELVDNFSTLADQKKTQEQTLLFTENAEVISIINGQTMPAIVGRKQIGEAFAGFLSLFEIVYHLNGQQTVRINGNSATGISYCQVTLIGTENAKRMKTTFGIYYNDEYVKRDNTWLISKRKSNFAWQDKQELAQ